MRDRDRHRERMREAWSEMRYGERETLKRDILGLKYIRNFRSLALLAKVFTSLHCLAFKRNIILFMVYLERGTIFQYNLWFKVFKVHLIYTFIFIRNSIYTFFYKRVSILFILDLNKKT